MEFDVKLINNILSFLAATWFDCCKTFKVEHIKYYKSKLFFIDAEINDRVYLVVN